jgi:hypothetical protein
MNTRKIRLVLLSAALLISAAATAQHVNIGIKAGLNIYNINNDNNVNYDTKSGFHAGLIGHIHLAKQLALQPELVYSAEGAKYTVLGITTTYHLDYLNVPFVFQYMFNNGFRLQAGPQLGFLLNAKSEVNNNSTDIKSSIKKVDFALTAGLGYVHPASGLGFDARYNFGLSDINENGSVKSTNRGFQLGLFYLFNHK